MGIVLAMANAICPYQNIYAQGDSATSLNTEERKLFLYIPESKFVVNPFPSYIFNLVQPLDSSSSPKGILNIKYDNLKTDIILAKDWSTITIKQYVDGYSYKIPFTADVEWYLRKYNERKSYAKFIQLVHQSAKDGTSKRKGQMMEVVGMDLGNLGRASLSLNGNVTITGNMIFQDQELVRSSLNQTQNTHLEFDQKQHLNIQGKIGDRITVNMDQDSERQFDWENNIRINYEGFEDDIIQKVEAGNISLSLPSTKYVTFSGKNQGLFGIKSISKLGPIDITTIASIEKAKKEQEEYKGGAQSSTQQIRDVDWIKNRYFFIHPWFRNGIDTLIVNNLAINDVNIPSFYPLKNGLHYLGNLVVKNFELYKSINTNDAGAVTGTAFINPLNSTDSLYTDDNETGNFIRLESGTNYEMSADLGYIRLRDMVMNEILGCSFTLEDRNTGQTVLEVGAPADSLGTNLSLMMLKPRNSHPNHPSWELMFKNVYYLGTTQINQDGFEVKLINKRSTPESERDRTTSLPYITLFGLDSLDVNGVRQYDEIIDFQSGNIINMLNGELLIPSLHPFALIDSLEGGNSVEALKSQLGSGKMYTSSISSEINSDNRFVIETKYSNQSSTINLGFMLVEGSEEVVQNNIVLKRGMDYQIDYFTGTIVLMGSAADDPNADLKVRYDRHEIVSFDKKTIFGTRAQMDLGEKSFIGATALYYNQSIMNQKIEVGYEPTRNFIWDLNGRYEWELDGITRLLDRFPIIETDKMTSLSIEGEIAQVLPNPNSISNSATGDPNGVAFIDDFEGSKRTTSPSIQRRFWKQSSAPNFYDTELNIFGGEYSQRNRGELFWYNPYIPVRTREIWPNQSTSVQAGNETTDVLVLRYRKRSHQKNIDNDSSWVGISTSLYSGDYDQTQSKFFEIWLKGNEGNLAIDLGKISEDWDGNGILNTEDIPEAGLTLGNGFLEDPEDTGLDGCFDDYENGWGGCLEDNTYQFYVEQNETNIINVGYDVDPYDPNGDNWNYDQGSSNYSKANGTEGNGTGSKIQEGGKYPDTEDLDRSGFIDKVNDYFSTSFDLTDTTYLAGQTEKNGIETGWKLFRIPLSDFKNSGSTEWNEIRYIRMSVSGFDSIYSSIQVAKIEIVGNEWQELGVFSPSNDSEDNNTVNLKKEKKILNSSSSFSMDNHDTPSFQIAVINTEDNAEYVPPDGVQGEYDRINQIRSKEQSLVMKFDNLPPLHSGSAQKTLYTLNDDQKRSFMTYDLMKMYVYGNSQWMTHLNTDIELFLRFGLGDDYYEVTQPVYSGWDEDKGRNSIELQLDWLAELKLKDSTSVKRYKQTDVFIDSADVKRYLYTDDEGIQTGKRIYIKGKPALNRIQYFIMGVRNTSDEIVDGEVWVDELRLSGVKKDRGVAMRVQSSLKLADLGSANFTYSRQDADFHRLQERLSRGTSTAENFNVSGRLDLHRFLPRSWGFILPVNASISSATNTPKYFPGEDILVDQNAAPDTIIAQSQTISFSASLGKTSKSDNKLVKYTIDNIKTNFSASQSRSSDITYTQKWSESYSGKVSYSLPFGRDNYVSPLKWVKEFPLVGSLSDWQIYYTPSGFNTTMSFTEKLSWNETRSSIRSPDSYNFGLSRNMNLDYKITNNLATKYAWTGSSKLNDYRGYAWVALKNLDPGLVTNVTETMNTTYSPKFLQWLKPNLSYSASYRWTNDLSREGQNISSNLRFNSSFTITPVQILEFFYKPPRKQSRNSIRSRGSRSRSRSRAAKQNESSKKKKESKEIKSLTFVHGIVDKVNPISLSYTETLNRSSNQVIGDVPVGYKFGWMPEHGLVQSSEVGSNLGSWDHKRDGSVRSGIKLSRLITVNFNFSQNFSSVISGSGIEQRTMSRDYIAVDEFFSTGMPFPGWSFRLAGVEKWPIIKWVAKSASIDHSYAGKETRSWQFEDITPDNINFFKLANFVDDNKDYERSSRINMNFSPLIGFNMSLKKNISVTFRHNRNLSLDELPTGLTIRKDHSYTSTASYTHRGGMTIPLPYYGNIKLNNNISFTLNFDMNDSKEFKSGDKIDLEEGAFSSNWKTGLRISYQFSNKISGGLRYEYRESDSRTMGEKVDRDFGFDINIAITG
ncbi:cell surface protein SprA [Candidatus Marinimicrobia bacterium]|nr:cell surface protein SprA [Candidatus Neomarinimicrobiota bacterium]